MNKRVAFLFAISMIFMMMLSACGSSKEVSAVKDTGETFMAALRDSDAITSWNMLTQNVQAEVGDIAKWQQFILPRNFSEWKFLSTNVEKTAAQIDGEAVLSSNTYNIVLVFKKIDNYWKIAGVNIYFKSQ